QNPSKQSLNKLTLGMQSLSKQSPIPLKALRLRTIPHLLLSKRRILSPFRSKLRRLIVQRTHLFSQNQK
ncbi:hypothetical protein, partial [Bifidobacterium aquikefiri]|uniref:hypothetical protein n=1 Tax=Bifidobacterium aquikefiri TaxID=1653207 RepID=UPI0039E943B3